MGFETECKKFLIEVKMTLNGKQFRFKMEPNRIIWKNKTEYISEKLSLLFRIM